MDPVLGLVGLTSALSLIEIGGGLYEFSVVDPFWPRRPDIIQPGRGGISRRRFWIPVHTTYEIVLIVTLVMTWSLPGVRFWLLIALVAHIVMRGWSAFDFIPKALAFERADPADIDEGSARNWTRRSLLRLPLDVVTAFAMLAAFAQAARLVA